MAELREQIAKDAITDKLVWHGMAITKAAEIAELLLPAIRAREAAAVAEAVKPERELADAAWEVFKKQEPVLASSTVKFLKWAFPSPHRAIQDRHGRVAWTLRYRQARGLLDEPTHDLTGLADRQEEAASRAKILSQKIEPPSAPLPDFAPQIETQSMSNPSAPKFSWLRGKPQIRLLPDDIWLGRYTTTQGGITVDLLRRKDYSVTWGWYDKGISGLMDYDNELRAEATRRARALGLKVTPPAPKVCGTCGDTGTVEDDNGYVMTSSPCPDCGKEGA